jgi:molybdate-binding protein/DNA-binding XRE family transcriptional regulator
VNRVKERREERGFSQLELARAAQLSRQTIGTIENGSSVPSVDVALRLSRALGCTVEHLFEPATVAVSASPVGAVSGPRVALAKVGGQWRAYERRGRAAFESADGFLESTRWVHPLRPLEHLERTLVIMGCAPIVGLLASTQTLQQKRCDWVNGSSIASIRAARSGDVHLASVHGAEPGASADSFRQELKRGDFRCITLGGWELGLVVAKGNPRRLRGVTDLSRPQLRIATREPGSVARAVFDRTLRQNGVRVRPIAQLAGHLEVAAAVSSGLADVGISTCDAARAYDLGFVALVFERVLLALPPAMHDEPRLGTLLDILNSGHFRREAAALGYSTADTGTWVSPC